MTQKELAKRLRVLGSPLRLRLLSLLLASKRPLCVCELAEVLGLPEYTVSRHLSALKKAGFITSEHRGPWVYYEPVSSPLLSALAPFLTPSAEDLQQLEARATKRRKNVCAMER